MLKAESEALLTTINEAEEAAVRALDRVKRDGELNAAKMAEAAQSVRVGFALAAAAVLEREISE